MIPVTKILDYYFVEVIEDTPGNPNIYCLCPLHQASRRHTNFSINRENGKWICFSKDKKGRARCGGGSITKLIMKLENCSDSKAKEILRGRFGRGKLSWNAILRNVKSEDDAAKKTKLRKVAWPEHLIPIPRNHPWIKRRRHAIETFRAFDVSYNSNEPHLVHFPIYFGGKLRGFSARDIRPKPVHKWKHDRGVPRKRLLYNFDQSTGQDYVIVVEGPLDALRLWSFGFRSVVAIFGSKATDDQVALMIENWSNIFVVLDGDEAGWDGAYDLCGKLMRHVDGVANVKMPSGKDPDNLGSKKEFLEIASQGRQLGRRTMRKSKSWDAILKEWS